MQIHTYRARTIQQALAKVRQELGPDAAVLHTRELSPGLLRRLITGTEVEVAASLAPPSPAETPQVPPPSIPPSPTRPAHQCIEAPSGRDCEPLPFVEPEPAHAQDTVRTPTALFDALNEMLEAGYPERECRQMLSDLRRQATPTQLGDRSHLTSRLKELTVERQQAETTS